MPQDSSRRRAQDRGRPRGPSPSHAPRDRLVFWGGLAVATACLGHLVYVNGLDRRDCRAWPSLQAAFKGQADGLAGEFAVEDHHVATLAPSGNVAVRLIDANRTGADRLRKLCFRSTYSLFPRRIYFCDPSYEVGDGLNLIGLDFHPDANWLQEHGVGTVLLVVPGGNRVIAFCSCAPSARLFGEVASPEKALVPDGAWVQEYGVRKILRERPSPGGNTEYQFFSIESASAAPSAATPRPPPTSPAEVLGSLAYVCILLLAGHAVQCAIPGPRQVGLARILGLSILLGAGTVGILLFLFSLAGVRPGRGLLAGLGLLSAAVLTVLAWRGRLVRPLRDPSSAAMGLTDRGPAALLAVGPAALFLYVLAAVAVTAVVFPLYLWDAFAIWSLKAKALAAEPLSARPWVFFEPSVAFSHPDYPLMLPFLAAGVHAMLGQINDRLAKLPCLLLYVGMILTVYSFLRERLSRAGSAALAAGLAALPAVVKWAGGGTADVPLAAFWAGAVCCLARWLREEKAEDLVLAALFTAMTAFTKNEGLGLAVIAAVVLGAFSLAGLRKRRLLAWAAFAGGTAAILLPWLLFRSGLPRSYEDYDARLSPSILLAHMGELGVILPALAKQVAVWSNWGALWVLLLLAAALGWRGFTRRWVLAVWALAALQVMTYVAAYMVTPTGAARLMPGTVDRLLDQVAPLAVLLIGWHGGTFAERGRDPGAVPPPAPRGRPA